MKLRFPFFLTQAALLSCLVPFSVRAVDVSSWEEMKTAYSDGNSSFKLTADITVPLTQNDAHLAGLEVEEGVSMSVDGLSSSGGRYRFAGTDGNPSGYGSVSRAFYGAGALSISSCLFDGNYVTLSAASPYAKGGAVWSSGAEGLVLVDCLFTGNRVLVDPGVSGGRAEGGAIYAGTGVLRNVTFEGNYVGAAAGSFGGAVSGEGDLVLEDCRFVGNYALKSSLEPSLETSCGGGVYYNVKSGIASMLSITARESDFIFRGNAQFVSLEGDGSFADGVANAIYIRSEAAAGMCDVHFRAAAGRSLLFYDPVCFSSDGNAPATTVYLNRADGEGRTYNGRVVFSGEDYRQSGRRENLISYCADNVFMIQDNGEVVIRDGAVLGMSADEYGNAGGEARDVIGMKKYELRKGVLEMSSQGRLLAETLYFEGGTGRCTWRPGSGARLDTGVLDISRGVTIDICSYLDNGNSGVLVAADTVRLGGELGIEDRYNAKGLASLDFYMDSRWAGKQKYLVFDFVKQADIQNDFVGVSSRLTGKSEVDSPYGYQGRWSELWEDSDGDSVKDKFYLVWTPAGTEPDNPDTPDNPNPPPVVPGIKEIHPEMAGALVMNSLWGVVEGMQAFSSAAQDRLDISRIQSDSREFQNYYFSGLGISSQHKSVGTVDGYDFSEYGVLAGADTLIGSYNSIAGISVGGSSSKTQSRKYSADIDSTARFVSLYYGWFKKMDKANTLKISWSVAYGLTFNDMDTYYSDGMYSSGSWDVDSFRLTLKGEWDCVLDDHWLMFSFAGLEYDNVDQGSFTEAGARVRSFEKAKLANLALPLGVGIQREDNYGDSMKWIHRLSLSLAPDISRKDPETSVHLAGNDFVWTAQGSERDRFALRLDYVTRFQLNSHWSLFAGYSLEGRQDDFYQMGNAGISIMF